MKKFFIPIVLLFLLPSIVSATDWYVRPSGGNYGLEDGTSYANSWDGLNNVVWGSGGVKAGDTLYICGTHLYKDDTGSWGKPTDIDMVSGSAGNVITIRGDCPGDPGVVWGHIIPSHQAWQSEGSNTYSITIALGTYGGWVLEDISGTSYTKLTKRNSVQEVKDNPGSYYAATYGTGDTFYVHCTDDGDPTDRIALARNGWNFNYPTNGQYITMSNLKLYGHYAFSWNTVANNSHHTWRNCTFHIVPGFDGFGIYDGNHYFTWENCIIEYTRTGIYTVSNTDNAPSHCIVRNCTVRECGTSDHVAPTGDYHGIAFQGGHDNLIEYNEVYNCAEGIGFYLDEPMSFYNNTVRYNYVHDLTPGKPSGGYGIWFSKDALIDFSGKTLTGNKVYGNILVGNGDYGGRGIAWGYPYVLDCYNNVIYNFDRTLLIGISDDYVTGMGINFKNNIIHTAGRYYMWANFQAYDPGEYSIVSDNNIFYPGTGNMFYLNDKTGTTTTDFSGWQSFSKPSCTFDPNSLTLNPLFVNPGNGNFHLQPNSPAIDNGTNVGLTLDFEGNPIPQGLAPDIGAYEYQGTGNIWYVRPVGGVYGNEDGSSYANAWDGLGNIVWGAGGVEAGDTLYICGLHLRTRTGGSAWEVFTPGVSGTDENARIIIRGDCPGDQGIIWGAGIMAHEPWVNEGSGVWSITAVGTPNSMWYFEDINEDSWTVLKQTHSLNDCRTTPGSFYSPDYAPGSIFYVHTSDGQDPTGRIAANRLGYNLKVDNRHYITWLNLKFYSIYRWIDNYGNPPYSFATHIRWENCTIWYGEHSHFLFRNNNAYNEFINCDIAYAKNGIGFAEYPIGSGSTGDGSEPHDHVIRGCTFHHIGIPYGDSDSHAIAGQGSRNIMIENNEMYLVGSGVTFYCYNTNQAIKNITIRYNWVHDTHSLWGANSRGLELNTGPGQAPGTSADVYGNIVGPNVSSVCYRYFWTEEGEFYNNVAYDCGTSFYIHHSLSPVNARIRNCISMNPQTYHIRFSSNNYSSVTSLDSDYNIFYPVDQDNFFIYVPEERLTDVSFSEWQSLSIPGYTLDPNSLGANPLFIDPQNGDFRLQSNSPAIDAGVFVGITKDYAGNTVPQGNGTDIGAYEYQSGAAYPPGDLDYDYDVDLFDLQIVTRDFGLTSGFDPRADTIPSNEIDIFDVVFVASKFT